MCNKKGKLRFRIPDQTRNHIFAVPVRKYLHSQDYFFQAGGCCMACYGKIFVLIYFVWKFLIDKRHKHECFWTFLICTMLSLIWQNRLNTRKNYSTCKVKRVVKVQLIWGVDNKLWGCSILWFSQIGEGVGFVIKLNA